MDYIIEGFMIGMGLNVLMGPIFIMVTQTAIEKGIRPGLFLTGGIWISDIIIVYLCLEFINKITPYTTDPLFKFYLGLIGGTLLILIGMRLVYTNNKNKDLPPKEVEEVKGFYYLTYSIKGFLVNVINPFTFFFWIGVFTTVIFGGDASSNEIYLFLVSLFTTIIVSDVLKVMLAEKIRHFLNKERMFIFNKYAGIVFMVLGIVLMLRSVV